MNDPNNQLPIKAEGDSLSVSRAASHPTTDRMVNDLLTRGRGKDLATQRYQVGDYFLCLPDYQQIIFWSKHFSIPPKELLSIFAESDLQDDAINNNGAGLFDGQMNYEYSRIYTVKLVIKNGRILKLPWLLDRIGGLPPNNWMHNLEITTLEVSGTKNYSEGTFAPMLNSLRSLHCDSANIKQIEISGCPSIEFLTCSRNKIQRLELSSCLSLRHLDCSHNELKTLDLVGLSRLETLQCSGNKLTDIDLTPCNELLSLSISENSLTSLDTLSLRKLEWLQCFSNKLDRALFMVHNHIEQRFMSGDDLDIDHFNLSVRPYCILKRNGINYVKDLRALTLERIKGLKNMNEKGAEDILRMMHEALWSFSAKRLLCSHAE